MRFSIVVPVYNVEKYLPDCLNSILGQSYKDYEMIIVDDGTLDHSGEIADSYAVKYPGKIKVIHQKNTGLGGARNAGIAMASGEYLIFVDSDDYILPDMLESLNTCLSEYKDDILCFQMRYITERGSAVTAGHMETGAYRKLSREEFIIGKPTAWDKVYKASLFQKKNISFPLKMVHEDLATIPAMALYTDKIGSLDKQMYCYRLRKDSIIHRINVFQYNDLCRALDCIYQYYEREEKYEEFYSELEWLTVKQIIFFQITRFLEDGWNIKCIKLAENFLAFKFQDYKNNRYVKENYSSLSENNKLLLSGNYRRAYFRLQIKKAVKAVLGQEGIAFLKNAISGGRNGITAN